MRQVQYTDFIDDLWVLHISLSPFARRRKMLARLGTWSEFTMVLESLVVRPAYMLFLQVRCAAHGGPNIHASRETKI